MESLYGNYICMHEYICTCADMCMKLKRERQRSNFLSRYYIIVLPTRTHFELNLHMKIYLVFYKS